MDLSDHSFHRAIDLIYEAVETPARWADVYEDLRQATGVKSIHVLATDKRHRTLSYSDGANLPVQGELAYMQHYRLLDPRLPALLERPLGGWLHCHEVVTEEDVATHPLYQEFLLPYDRRYMSACKLADTADATVIFSVLNAAAHGPLEGAALDYLDRLLPHLRRACRIGLQHFVYSHQALVGHMLVDRLRQPVFLMTPGGDVLYSNQAAREMMRSTTQVRVDDGRLQLPQPGLDELLAQCAALEQAAKAAPAATGEPGSQFRSLQLRPPREEGAGDALYAFFNLLTPGEVMGSFGLRPVVMLLFYHPASAPAMDSGLLFAVFGLTPAECRVATLLAEGLTPRQIAEAHGTRQDTVRKQLRSIFQKTSTSRQPELVRLLLHLPHHAVQR